jgi:hypothetical protein
MSTMYTLGLILTGYGAYSLDGALGMGDRWTSALTWVVVAMGVLGGLVNAALRRPTTTA